ncbi:hypothetical protein SE19_00040, partial [Acidiplasma aeolicum]
YLKGFNPVSIITLIITFFIVFAPLYGIKYHIFIILKDASWISGFVIAFILYLVLSLILRDKKWEKASES